MEEEEAAAAIAGSGARTVNPELQKRLDLLAELSRRGDIRGFVRVFVPTTSRRMTRTTSPASWKGTRRGGNSLHRRSSSSPDGSKVLKIVGDQTTRAEFRYLMPNQALAIQREVVFYCENGDWRAEG